MNFWSKTRAQTFNVQLAFLTAIVSLFVWFASNKPFHGVLAGGALIVLSAMNAWLDARAGIKRQSLFQSVIAGEDKAIARFRVTLLVLYWGAVMWLAVWFPDPLWITVFGTAMFGALFFGLSEYRRRNTN